MKLPIALLLGAGLVLLVADLVSVWLKTNLPLDLAFGLALALTIAGARRLRDKHGGEGERPGSRDSRPR